MATFLRLKGFGIACGSRISLAALNEEPTLLVGAKPTLNSMNWFKSFWEKLTGADPARCESIANFTPRAQQVLALAGREANRLKSPSVNTEHLLLGLLKLGKGVAINVLKQSGLDLDALGREIEKQAGSDPQSSVAANVPYTSRVKNALALAAREARALHHTHVGTEHLLLGLLREGDSVAARVLKQFKVDLEKTRQAILKELDPNFSPGDQGQKGAAG
jgi:ATP-dependent Clp protease ATP-binding subunit ClpC